MRLEQILILESPCYLHINSQRLAIDRDNGEGAKSTVYRALLDIGGVIIDTPRVMMTAAVLQQLAEFGVPVLVSSTTHLPHSLFMPHSNHTATVTRQRAQARLKESTKNAIWKRIVKAKINNQRLLLAHYGYNKPLARLKKLADTVRSGDPSNHEAQAAIHYWQACFGNDFKRDKPLADDTLNRSLNYGYAIVRALIARYVAMAGLAPAFGCGHSNVLNPLCLVDDLIEPFRPTIDSVVIKSVLPLEPWSTDVKRRLLGILDQTVSLKESTFRITSAAFDVVQSYVDAVIYQDADNLQLPGWQP